MRQIQKNGKGLTEKKIFIGTKIYFFLSTFEWIIMNIDVRISYIYKIINKYIFTLKRIILVLEQRRE